MDRLWREREWLYHKYVTESLSTIEIAKLSKCSRSTILNWLHRHSIQMRTRYNSTSATVRFWRKVDRHRPSDCWEWTASATSDGYGLLGVNGGLVLAHRFSWTLHNGPIPEGLCILHKCDNPPCVNPDHLFIGTRADNMHDMIAKGRGRRKTKLCKEKLKLGCRKKRILTYTSYKLSRKDVDTILANVGDGQSQISQAILFNVSESLISLIVNGKRHVANNREY